MLNYTWKGIKFPNPFILAPAPPTRNADMIMSALKQGWGGAIIKTLSLHPERVHESCPRLHSFRLEGDKKKLGPAFGFLNTELISRREVKEWEDDVARIKDAFPDKVIIASFNNASDDLEGWKELTTRMQNVGADIIQMNAACPNKTSKGGVAVFDINQDIVKAVKSVAKIPVWVKLPADLPNVVNSAKIALDAGADGFSAINTIKGFPGIDIESLEPAMNLCNGYTTYGGCSGYMVKPFALKYITQVAKAHPKSYISGTGGIMNWQDGVEFMLCGCSSLQMCTQVMFKGFGIINGLLKGMEGYMNKHSDKFNSVESMIGYSLPRIVDFADLHVDTNPANKQIAEIDNKKCTKCGSCSVACRDGGFQAIYLNKSNPPTYHVNTKLCDGCGLCASVCQYSAIKMVPKE